MRSRRTRTARQRPAARAPSTRPCPAPRPRAATWPEPALGTAPSPARIDRARESLAHRPARLRDRVRHLWRHVVLVVLGEDFLGDEGAVRVELAAGDDALAFTEQVRKHAG